MTRPEPHRDALELRRASTRLAWQFGVLILVLVTGLGLVVYGIVAASQNEAARRTLMAASHIDSPRDAPPSVFVTIVPAPGGTSGAGGPGGSGGPAGQILSSPNLPSGLPDEAAIASVQRTGTPTESTQSLAGSTFLIQTSAHDGTTVQVALDLHEQQDELQRLTWALVFSGALAAIAAGAISVWMSRRAMRPMADALALQRRFVADASHELRTPLTLLSTRAQLLRRRANDPSAEAIGDVSAGIEEIVQDSRALTEILEDLLIAADPRESAEREPVELTELADEIVHGIDHEAEARGLSLSRLGSVDSVRIDGTRVSIQRLMTALIDNALDHATSSVTVTVDAVGRDAEVRVADDGPGFPAGMDDRVFDRFASARSASARNAPSAPAAAAPRHYGLGLSLVAEVAARHGGTVGIERTGQAGAVVVVRIPLAKSTD